MNQIKETACSEYFLNNCLAQLSTVKLFALVGYCALAYLS